MGESLESGSATLKPCTSRFAITAPSAMSPSRFVMATSCLVAHVIVSTCSHASALVVSETSCLSCQLANRNAFLPVALAVSDLAVGHFALGYSGIQPDSTSYISARALRIEVWRSIHLSYGRNLLLYIHHVWRAVKVRYALTRRYSAGMQRAGRGIRAYVSLAAARGYGRRAILSSPNLAASCH